MTAATTNGSADRVVSLLLRRFLNRQDAVAFLPPWAKTGASACRANAGENLVAMLRAHVKGDGAEAVDVDWATLSGKSGKERGRFRIGSYNIGTDSKTRWACVDFDGGGYHGHPLANPLDAALRFLDNCHRAGLPCYLERSGSGTGWHVWVFFAERVPAIKVRRLLFALIPDGIRLADDKPADARANVGMEVFPKQDAIEADGFGNMVWLPWWANAAEGGNQFYRIADDGELAAYLPDDFEAITEAQLDQLLAEAQPEPGDKPKKPSIFKGRASSAAQRDASGRVTADELLGRAFARMKPGASGDLGRNATGHWLACQLRDNRFSESEAKDILGQYQRQADKEGEHPYTEKEALASVRSAYAKPAREPWGQQERREQENGNQGEIKADAEVSSNARLEDEVHLTDLGNARRVIRRFGSNLRYCWPQKSWLGWDGRRWKDDDTAAVVRCVKQTIGDEYRITAARIKELGEVGDDDERKVLVAKLTAMLKHCIAWEGAKKIGFTLDLMRSESCIPILPAQLDADPFLFNVRNGTIDLRTGNLRPHRQTDYITKLAPVDYDPDADAPLWCKVLSRLMDGNGALVTYLQRVVGHCLTGDVSEQCLWFLHGDGSNGKSTFLLLLLALLGDYGIQAVSDLLLMKNNESHPTERADLFGKRFVCTIEADKGKRLAEAIMKQMTGGDRIRARKMRQDFFEFDATHKLFLCANHKPVIRGTDHATWRRIKLVPFTVTISDTEKDKNLLGKLKAELPGILAWAVRGCLEWQRNGLQEPDEVKAATAAYRAEQDLVSAFIDECCFVSTGVRVRATTIYEAYQKWGGDPNTSQTAFGLELERRGFHRDKIGGVVYRMGIALGESAVRGRPGQLGQCPG